MASILSTENLYYTHPGATQYALKNINLEVKEGDFTLIAGPTGSGKSTLALCLTGLIPQVIVGDMKGTVLVDGKDTRQYEVYQMAQYIGLVFQNAENQLCALDVEDEIAFGPRHLNLSKEETEARVENTLRLMQLEQFRDRDPQTLSRGQKIGLAVASVLSMKPKVLILDEPTLGQDSSRINSLVSMLKTMSKEGLAIVVITHDINFAAEHASRVVVIDNGKILLDGEPHMVLSQEEVLHSASLEPPGSVRLSKLLGLPPMLTVDEISKALQNREEAGG